MAVILVAQYYAQTGKGDVVADALLEMVPLVKSVEPGCLVYSASRSIEDPDEFLLYEVYRDEQAVQAHRVTPHFQRLIEGKIVPLLERRDRHLYVPL